MSIPRAALPKRLVNPMLSLLELGKQAVQFSIETINYLKSLRNELDQIQSGVWTPTLTNTANIDSSTAFQGQYTKIGDVVIASCRADIDPTAAGVTTHLGISLPVASVFVHSYELVGVATAPDLGGGQTAGTVKADTANKRAILECFPAFAVSNQLWIIFQYQVL